MDYKTLEAPCVAFERSQCALAAAQFMVALYRSDPASALSIATAANPIRLDFTDYHDVFECWVNACTTALGRLTGQLFQIIWSSDMVQQRWISTADVDAEWRHKQVALTVGTRTHSNSVLLQCFLSAQTTTGAAACTTVLSRCPAGCQSIIILLLSHHSHSAQSFTCQLIKAASVEYLHISGIAWIPAHRSSYDIFADALKLCVQKLLVSELSALIAREPLGFYELIDPRKQPFAVERYQLSIPKAKGGCCDQVKQLIRNMNQKRLSYYREVPAIIQSALFDLHIPHELIAIVQLYAAPLPLKTEK